MVGTKGTKWHILTGKDSKQTPEQPATVVGANKFHVGANVYHLHGALQQSPDIEGHRQDSAPPFFGDG